MKWIVFSILFFYAVHVSAADKSITENYLESSKLVVALIGMGEHMTEKLIPALDENKYQWEFACRRDIKKLKQQQELYKIPNITNDYNSLFQQPSEEAVMVAGDSENLQAPLMQAIIVSGDPESLHVPVIECALKAGIHIFVEKPVSLSLFSIQRLAADAEKSRSIVMVGFNFTHTPTVKLLQAKFRRNELLNLSIICQLNVNSFGEGTYQKNFEVVFDNDYYFAFIHAVSVLVSITGKPQEIKHISSMYNKINNDYNFSVSCATSSSDESLLTFRKSISSGFHLTIEYADINGEKVSCELNNKNDPNGSEKQHSYTTQFDEFYRCIVAGEAPENNLQRNLEIHETLELIKSVLHFA